MYPLIEYASKTKKTRRIIGRLTWIIPAANTAMSLSLAALTIHVDPFFKLHRNSHTASGPPFLKS
jgi:hypothetical protein